MKAFSFNATGSETIAGPTSTSAVSIGQFGPTPSVSANGTSNGIVWIIQADAYNKGGPAVLRAFDANNLATELYNSNQNANDSPGGAVKFTVPTVANGKVYVGTSTQLSVYGLLDTVATPTFSPPAGVYVGTQSVALADATPGATIYYTTNGNTPTLNSKTYTGPITIRKTATVNAIAAAPGYQTSPVAGATYTIH